LWKGQAVGWSRFIVIIVSDLAVAMKVPVLAVAYNRLGCLNHAVLTVHNILGYGLHCTGLVLNTPQEMGDIARKQMLIFSGRFLMFGYLAD
jgi:dethiobiotin synthetase